MKSFTPRRGWCDLIGSSEIAQMIFTQVAGVVVIYWVYFFALALPAAHVSFCLLIFCNLFSHVLYALFYLHTCLSHRKYFCRLCPHFASFPYVTLYFVGMFTQSKILSFIFRHWYSRFNIWKYCAYCVTFWDKSWYCFPISINTYLI